MKTVEWYLWMPFYGSSCIRRHFDVRNDDNCRKRMEMSWGSLQWMFVCGVHILNVVLDFLVDSCWVQGSELAHPLFLLQLWRIQTSRSPLSWPLWKCSASSQLSVRFFMCFPNRFAKDLPVCPTYRRSCYLQRAAYTTFSVLQLTSFYSIWPSSSKAEFSALRFSQNLLIHIFTWILSSSHPRPLTSYIIFRLLTHVASSEATK